MRIGNRYLFRINWSNVQNATNTLTLMPMNHIMLTVFR